MKRGTFFTVVVGMLYLVIALGLDLMPRSGYSELEKRDLKHFPSFTLDSLLDGSYTGAISAWYGDTEPFRDSIMYFSMQFRDLLGVRPGDNAIEFVSGDVSADSGESAGIPVQEPFMAQDTLRVAPFQADTLEDDAGNIAKVANTGIILVGSGQDLRALMGFFGTENGGLKYAEAVSQYGKAFGGAVRVWCMPIPTSTEYYCPEQAAKFTRKQWPVFNAIFENLTDGVRPVDVYSELAAHVDEPIYLRTDHHWAPLGAYYAARKFAGLAGTPFRDLSDYEQHVVHGFVGSMYGYSQNVAVKKAPEDFIYHIPTGVEYATTYINYTLDEEFHVTEESKPFKGKYFFQFKDGSGAAYTTFMGGDLKQTKVETSAGTGRRLLVIKDSFGNALPGYLFYSFEEIHVVDFRYFAKNMKEYVRENKITDILFANNIFKAYSSHTYGSYLRFLHQQWHRPGADPAKAKGDSAVKHKVHQPEAPKPEKEPSEPVKSTEPVVESKEMAEPTVKERATNQTGSQQ